MLSPFLSFDPFVAHLSALLAASFLGVFFLPPPSTSGRSSVAAEALGRGAAAAFPPQGHSARGTRAAFLALFLCLVLSNLVSLWTYVFTPTAHVAATATLSLVLWAGIISLQWASASRNALAHLVPTGTPVWLVPLMVVVEVASVCIRPVTLGVRLAANMTAGHLILGLLGVAAAPSGLTGQIPLLCLEALVALVQGFVFCMLLSLYMSEL